MIKLAIFDWDGVLYDSSDLHYGATKFALAHFSIPCPHKHEIKKKIHADYMQFYYDLGVPRSVTQRDMCALWDEYCEGREDEVDLHDYAVELLAYLRSHHIRVALVSSTEHSTLLARIQRHNILHYFDTIAGDAVERKKAIRLTIAHFSQIKASECAYIDDTPNGVALAKDMGIEIPVGIVHERAYEADMRKVTQHIAFSLRDVRALLHPGILAKP